MNKQFKYISRITAGRQKTWFVRVRGLPGKSFCDNKHAGCMPALTEAVKWRDEKLGSNKDLVLDSYPKRYHTKPFKSNKSTKILGVRVEEKISAGKSYYSYVAYSGIYPNCKKRNFSWNKYGMAEALALAVQFRSNAELERKLANK